jgi:hypothetical protein
MILMKQPRLTKALPAIGETLLLLLFVSYVLRQKAERRQYEVCRRLHQQIADRIARLVYLQPFGKARDSDVPWNDACETVHVVYLMSWGHYPSSVSEESCRRLSQELDRVLQTDRERAVILDRVWKVIGGSCPFLHRHLQQHQDGFDQCLARLIECEAIAKEEER